MIGVGIIIPLLAPLFFAQTGMLPLATTQTMRALLFGLLMAVFPLAQFFGSPLLGTLSDMYGRKKVLSVTLLGTVLGYVGFAFGILTSSLTLIFISRTVAGFFAGNISVAFSTIADIRHGQEKVKAFGLVGMAFGLGIVIGPFLGGVLADSNLVSWFGFSTPFFFAALLSLINFTVLQFKFQETLKEKRSAKVSLFTGFTHLKHAITHKTLRNLFLFSFLYTLGFMFFTTFFSVLLVERFSLDETHIGYIFAFLGVCIAVVQGLIVRKLSMKYTPMQLLPFSTLVLTFIFLLYMIPKSIIGIYFIIPIMALFNGISMPNVSALISNSAGKDEQGSIFGVNQSLQAVAQIIPGLLSGVLVSISFTFPFIVASVLTFIAWLVLVFMIKKN